MLVQKVLEGIGVAWKLYIYNFIFIYIYIYIYIYIFFPPLSRCRTIAAAAERKKKGGISVNEDVTIILYSV